MGSDVAEDETWDDMLAFADLLGVPVAMEDRLAVDFSAFPMNHPYYVGSFTANEDLVKNADVMAAPWDETVCTVRSSGILPNAASTSEQ